MKILVLNAGSSSLKFKLFRVGNMKVSASGMIEQIGERTSHAELTYFDKSGAQQRLTHATAIRNHSEALEIMERLFKETEVLNSLNELLGIGHRVVHGGESFHEPVIIDNRALAAIRKLIPLAPLHNPVNLKGIEVAMEHAPDVPMVAVFDTAFHQTIPEYAFLYALPYNLYEKQKIRRYGFHGTSHQYVGRKAAEFLEKPFESLKIITLHLGNGASATAIRHGKSVDTSMGMTPLEGLVMGTRSGDLDPAILFYLARETGMDIQELDDLLNKQSGLKGICDSNDMRTISELADSGVDNARLAMNIFCYRIKKYIGSYLAVLGGADCIVFTGGIGENAAEIRALSCQGLDDLGISLDAVKNSKRSGEIIEIQAEKSRTRILVIPTDEEFEIGVQTRQLIVGKEKGNRHAGA
jgi:acetate kinase